MQNICLFECTPELKIEYIADDNSFYIKSASSYHKLEDNSRLYADFTDGNSFEVGLFKKENELYIIDAKYSIAYLITQDIDIRNLSGFSVHFENGELISASVCCNNADADDFMNDSSVIRARDLLEEYKSHSKANEFILEINKQIESFHNVKIPVLTDFSWYIIDKDNEYFGLSSVHFAVSSLSKSKDTPWFFGKCNDNRLYAVLIRADENVRLNNMSDCIVKYRDSATNSLYCAIGIMLLDDGQYFCRLA